MGSHVALVKRESPYSDFRLTELHTGFWFWLEGIAERNLSLSQPHTVFLVLVRGDCRKESQSIPTTHRFFGSG